MEQISGGESVVIFGNGPVAREVYYSLKDDSPHEPAAFAVDKAFIDGDTMLGLPVVAFEEVAAHFPPDRYSMYIAVGFVDLNRLRAARFVQAKEMGYRLVSYISNTASIRPDIEHGENCSISPFSVVASSVKIGDNVTIGAGCTIGHDVHIKDHCFISDRVIIPGYVTVEPYCFIGAGATLRNKITVGAECVISAGAVLLKDSAPKEVYLAKETERLAITSDKLSLK